MTRRAIYLRPWRYDSGVRASRKPDPAVSPREVKRTARTHGDVLTAISDGMVALLKEYYGRGPTRAKSYYEDDLVVCVLRGGFRGSSRRCSKAGAARRSSTSEWSFKSSCASASRP